MVIDFHAHTFPDALAGKTIAALEERAGIKAATDGTLNGLLVSMDHAKADMSVILPVVTKPSQFENINRFAASINQNYAGKLLSFGGIHPDCEDYRRELNIIKELGLPGVKIHPDYQGVMIDDVRYMNIIEYADELGLIIVTHAGIDIGLPDPVHCPPDKMRRVLDKIRPKKMVVAHYGGWKQWEEVYEYLAGYPIYLDTAMTFGYIEQEWFLKILEKHDKDKILFATDSPWSSLADGIQALKNMPLETALIGDILGNNAERILGWES